MYLHYALDLWFERKVKKHCDGQAIVIRYADDFVCAFQNQADAQAFYRVLPKRLEKFGLAVAPEKTRILRFSCLKLGLSGHFAFVGFELYWDRDWHGVPRVRKRTMRSRLRRAKRRIKLWCKENRHLRGREFVTAFNRKLVGHYNYYGLRGNNAALSSFYSWAIGCAFKWLNRRGGKRRSFTWDRFKSALKRLGVALPRITERRRVNRVFA